MLAQWRLSISRFRLRPQGLPCPRAIVSAVCLAKVTAVYRNDRHPKRSVWQERVDKKVGYPLRGLVAIVPSARGGPFSQLPFAGMLICVNEAGTPR